MAHPIRIAALALAGVALLALGGLAALGLGVGGRFDSDGSLPDAPSRSPGAVAAVREAQASAARAVGEGKASQILFGDLHVHTTISFDAFMLNLPVVGGEGAHPPADACDFARHCAALDFWSMNDHAENIHPDDWRSTVESVRQCNALAGDPDDPDVVALLGWEWTQAGLTPETHYGHKNVVLASTDDAEIPTRPIAADAGGTARYPPGVLARGLMALQSDRLRDLALRWTSLSGLPVCPEGPVRELSPDCREVAPTPADLFRKLDDWGHEALVIPHGTTWGIYTPPGSSWEAQLAGDMHDPERQTLLEVYSGHGDSEVYRDWRAVERRGPDGAPVCPEERADFLPMCRRAGAIVERRCLEAGEAEAECASRAAEARHNAVAAGVSPHATVAGASGADWLDAGQCRDCGQPSFMYRPTSSAQYLSAIGNFDGDAPRHFRMAFIASSDIHNARAGSGYKESPRRAFTDAGHEPPADGAVASFFEAPPETPRARSRTIEEARKELTGLQLYESERAQSFLYSGGLVAIHAEGRSRGAVWSALAQRAVYATSGPRILLWVDLLGEDGARLASMGGEVRSSQAPILRVRAVGSFEQRPGCPDETREALGEARLETLCAGECYHPGDARRGIERIEVVRIRPQQRPGEDVAALIDDPWRTFSCSGEPGGCEATFRDDEFASAGRTALYYARVFEEPRATVNGDPLRCRRDADGRCLESRPCRPGEECLAPYAPRAWSSPVWVDFDAGEERE